MNRTYVSNRYSILLLLLLLATHSHGQLTLDSCYRLAQANYPLIKSAALIRESEKYNLSNIQKGYLPQISFAGQATYQSDVTGITGIPNLKIEPLSKDQYKIVADLNQNIYDGGALRGQRKIQQVSAELELANVQKDLYDVKERVTQIFFSALLLNVQLEQNNTFIEQLQQTKLRVDSSIANGASAKADADQLLADILTQQERSVELRAGIKQYLSLLSAFIGKPIDRVQDLVSPTVPSSFSSANANTRPELYIFKLQNNRYNLQRELTDAKLRPRVSIFGEGGYGKPGLNFLKNEFVWFYTAGLKMNWNFSALYTNKNEKQLLQNSIARNNVQQETFLFNNNLTLIQQTNEAEKIARWLDTDQHIVLLRENTSKAARAKYENGASTLNDYTKALTDLQQANLNYQLHKMQQLLNYFNQQITLGK